MKEIKIAGKLECNFNTQLQRHMDNVDSKLNDLVDAIKLARNDGYNLTVDIGKLEKEALLNMDTNKTKEYTVKIKVDTSELDCAIKKLKKFNKLVKKSKLPRVIFSTHGNLDEKEIINLLDKYQWK